MTERVRQHVAEWVRQDLAVSVAAEGLTSWPNAHVLGQPRAGVDPGGGAGRVLGIDETGCEHPVWRLARTVAIRFTETDEERKNGARERTLGKRVGLISACR